jgi:hypothetical protein
MEALLVGPIQIMDVFLHVLADTPRPGMLTLRTVALGGKFKRIGCASKPRRDPPEHRC